MEKQTFVNYGALLYATKTHLHPKKGDIAYCEKEDSKYGFNGSEWVPLTEVTDAQVPTGLTIYEANKQLVSQLPPMSLGETQECIAAINSYAEKTDNLYFMLLCKEYSYYTILVYNPIDEHDFSSLGDGVITLLSELGTIHTYHINDMDIELWVTIGEETLCFHLFGYDLGVVTYG